MIALKKLIVLCSVTMGIVSFVGCSQNNVTDISISSETQIQADIKDYFKNNLEYTLKDLRVVEEDDGTFAIVATLGMEYTIDDFTPFAEQLIQISETALTEFNVKFTHINPALYTGADTWIGWSNDSLHFYNQDKYLAENVSLDMLKNEVEKYKVENGYDISNQESNEVVLSYEEMQDEIINYLDNHNDISQIYSSVTVKMNIGKVEFNVELQAYETYTFAAVVSATTDIIRTLVEENDIEEYRVWVHSPSDAKYTLSWISFNLDVGLLNDKGYDDDYNEMIKLDDMLKRYGYEDFEGSL